MAITLRRAGLKSNEDTGFGTNPDNYGGRFVNRDGTFNVRKEGIPFFRRFSLYHTMLNIPTWKFYGALFAFYLSVNFIFGCIYFFIGSDQFQGVLAKTSWGIFKELFFFSTETYTTVGYGRVNPVGDLANSVSAIESMLGFLSFAIATGLLYGRFSKPKAFLFFSKQALVSPYRGGTGLMFRFAAYKDHHTLTNLEIKVNAAMQVDEGSKMVYKFYDLELERSRVETLPMNWTVVHPLNQDSPLFEYSHEDMKKADLEIYVSIRGFDDVYSNLVQQRTSYTYDEIVFGRKFIQMYRESSDGKTTIVELQKLHDHREVKTNPDTVWDGMSR